MSRVAKKPVPLASGVQVTITDDKIVAKGPKGQLEIKLHLLVAVTQEGNELIVSTKDVSSTDAWAQAGTTRALLNNMITGVSKGFERKLQLVGVGYRAQAKGKTLSLTLGFSHPVEFELPDAVKCETPSQTEILLSSADKQLLGQVAANVRSFRPPEPYKGKGVRYSDETVLRKEAKKK